MTDSKHDGNSWTGTARVVGEKIVDSDSEHHETVCVYVCDSSMVASRVSGETNPSS